MTRVDFYFIPESSLAATQLFACRLLEKAYLQNHQIHVHVDTEEKARSLDHLLWTFRDESFLPHTRILLNRNQPESAIEIGHNLTSASHQDILLNMHPEIPAFYEQFKRVLQIIPKEAQALDQAQLQRVFYEEKGHLVNIHPIAK